MARCQRIQGQCETKRMLGGPCGKCWGREMREGEWRGDYSKAALEEGKKFNHGGLRKPEF